MNRPGYKYAYPNHSLSPPLPLKGTNDLLVRSFRFSFLLSTVIIMNIFTQEIIYCISMCPPSISLKKKKKSTHQKAVKSVTTEGKIVMKAVINQSFEFVAFQ